MIGFICASANGCPSLNGLEVIVRRASALVLGGGGEKGGSEVRRERW